MDRDARVTSYLGLGSNLGDRRTNLEEAMRRIDRLAGTSVRNVASAWETPPVGYLDQDKFLNTACVIETDVAPVDLLKNLKGIEKEMGREPGPRYGPRLIDIDILLYDSVVMEGPPTIPHPEMHKRAFVLAPLAEIAPSLSMPDGQPIVTLLQNQDMSGIVRLSEPLDAP